MVARAERVSQTETLAFCHDTITSIQALEAYDSLAGRIFRLSPPDSLSARVMEKYTFICGTQFQSIPSEKREMAFSVPTFGSDADLRTQALIFTLTELRSALYKELPSRHVQARVDTMGCYFEVVTE